MYIAHSFIPFKCYIMKDTTFDGPQLKEQPTSNILYFLLLFHFFPSAMCPIFCFSALLQ